MDRIPYIIDKSRRLIGAGGYLIAYCDIKESRLSDFMSGMKRCGLLNKKDDHLINLFLRLFIDECLVDNAPASRLRSLYSYNLLKQSMDNLKFI